MIGEPAGFFNLRKTIGDKIWLAISSPGTSDNSANQMQIKGYDEAVIKRLRKYMLHIAMKFQNHNVHQDITEQQSC